KLLPEICVSAGVFSVFCIGVDRFLSSLDLLRFKTKLKWFYLSVHFIAIASFSLYTVYLMVAYYTPELVFFHLYANTMFPRRVICSIPSPFHGRSIELWNRAMSLANISSVFVYAATWIVIRNYGAPLANQHLFRKICFVMAIDIAGWTITNILLFLLVKSNLREGRQFALHYIAGIAVNSGVAFKAVVYYLT
ncbi:hypothetical protein PMAYCL1PPCAC_15221, partial [Pristionchus mayeri]